jgi:hypothetical protein
LWTGDSFERDALISADLPHVHKRCTTIRFSSALLRLWIVDSSLSRRFPPFHLKNRRTFTLFTTYKREQPPVRSPRRRLVCRGVDPCGGALDAIPQPAPLGNSAGSPAGSLENLSPAGTPLSHTGRQGEAGA